MSSNNTALPQHARPGAAATSDGRRTAEPASAEVEALLHETLLTQALSNGGHALVLADDDGRVVAVNETACQLLGYPRRDLSGTDARTFAPAISDFTGSLALWRGTRQTLTCTSPNGLVREIGCWLTPTWVAHLPFILIVVDPVGAKAESPSNNASKVFAERR